MDKTRPTPVHDYDALRDVHLKRFFSSETMQRHMSHAAALDRISTRRNPWNDAIEFLMEAGSAYNVGSIFNSNDEFLNNNNNGSKKHPKNRGGGGGGARSSSAAAAPGSAASSQRGYRPTPPSASQGRGRPTTAPRSATATGSNKQQQQQQSQKADPSKLPPLPRFNAALRNIRRFDDEVQRVIHEGSRTENDQKEQERWDRMQQRIKVERMLREANSPKMGKRSAKEHEESAERRRQKEEEEEYYRRLDDDGGDDGHADYHGHGRHSYHDQERAMDERGKFFYPKQRGGGTRSLSLSLLSNNKKKSRQQQQVGDDDDEFQALTPSRPERIPGWVTFALTRFQANCIGWVVRNKIQRSRDAVTRIQRSFRNHLSNRGVSLAVRIIQRAGRALKIRHRVYLLAERHRLWQDANDELLLLHDLCQNLHRAAGNVARLPVLEAHAREKIIGEEEHSIRAQGFEATAGELTRRALLTCVAPKGKLRRESFRRLLDDEEDGSNPPVAKDMRPMDTPPALVPALQEIEEDEPKRRTEEEELKSPTSPTLAAADGGGGGDDDSNDKKQQDGGDEAAPAQEQQQQQQEQQQDADEKKEDGDEQPPVAAAVSPSTGESSIASSSAPSPVVVASPSSASAAPPADDNAAAASGGGGGPDDTLVVVAQDDADAREDAEAKRLADEEARLAPDDDDDVDTTIRPVAHGDDDEEEL